MRLKNKKLRRRRKRRSVILSERALSYSFIILSIIVISFLILNLNSLNNKKYGEVIKTVNFTQVGKPHILFFYVENKENITKDCTIAMSISKTQQKQTILLKNLMPLEKRLLNVTIYKMPEGTSKTILSLNCTVSKK